ncbi:MAG TPA: LEA type 2 family protein [Parasegetibacter sp.]
MNTGNMLAGLLAVIIALSPFLSCKTPKDLVYVKTSGVKLESMGTKESVLKMEVHYYNPNKFKLKLKEADCEVFVNDKYAGKFDLDSLMQIPKRDTFAIPVKLQIDMGSVLKHGLAILLNPDLKVKIAGSALIGRMGISQRVKFSYAGIHRIEW